MSKEKAHCQSGKRTIGVFLAVAESSIAVVRNLNRWTE